MYVDVLKLRDWYFTPVGHTVRRVVQAYLNEMWPTLKGERVLVVGYGIPYINLWLKESQVFCAMPAGQGVVHWPQDGDNRTTLVWDSHLPFADLIFDKILLIHELEFANEAPLLDECERVLKPDGRLLSVVPNRTGAWCRREEVSPFGRGRPFSGMQMNKLMRKNGFLTTQSCYGLFIPPTRKEWILKYYDTAEKIGQRWRAPLGGVLLTEAKKDHFGGKAVRVEDGEAAVRRPCFNAAGATMQNKGNN